MNYEEEQAQLPSNAVLVLLECTWFRRLRIDSLAGIDPLVVHVHRIGEI
jgi:hypothetical protein